MPLTHQSLKLNKCQVAIWEITESVEELQSMLDLNTQQETDFTLRKTIAGKKGFLAVRNALNSLGQKIEHLNIANDGAPELPQGYCSLSHSNQYAIATFAAEPLGVDIENYRPKIQRIAKKFVHPEEAICLPENNQTPWLTRLWTAKEAIYKAMREPGLSLAQNINVAPFSMKDNQGEAVVLWKDKSIHFQLQFSTFNEHELTLAQPIIP